MDIARPPKKGSRLKHAITTLSIVMLSLAVGIFLWTSTRGGLSVNGDNLIIAEVKQGSFTVSVKGTGILVPQNVQWLAADVEATVVRRVVRPGKQVKKGDLIVQLANPQLEQQMTELQWELAALTEEMKAETVNQETQLLAQQTQVLNTQLDLERSQLEQNAQSILIQTGAVSAITYQRTQLETQQFEQRLLSEQQQHLKMKENLAVQNKARQARLNQLKNRLSRMEQRVDGLNVRATLDSIVLDVPVEAGQRIQAGTSIAKLAEQHNLYAELNIPEQQIRNIAVGQPALIDTRNSVISGIVSRIDPAVESGVVTVDIEFTQTAPPDARPDLSIDGEIRITEIEDTLYVTRPLYSQAKTQAAVYRVSSEGNLATRTPVRFGSGSPNQIEILEGLAPTDRIIVSDPSVFQHKPEFRIQ